jgi:hypothetical protein
MSGLTLIKNTSDQGVIDAALEIAKQRRNTLLALKTAIRGKNLAEADQLITQLVPDNEKSDTTVARINRRPGRRR